MAIAQSARCEGQPTAHQLDPALCWRMVRSRDPRFDGLFFFGVKSTGIYCRSVCPARTPLARNCLYFEHAAQAEQAGFRPCLRCRPELAPGRYSGSTSGTESAAEPGTEAQRLVQRVLAAFERRLLGDGGQAWSLQALAHGLGVSDRHLRRIFVQEIGVAPQAYLQTQQLLMAKRLLTDTRLPVIDVAAIAGFGSLRRFNTLWRQRYGITPTQLRRRPKALDGIARSDGAERGTERGPRLRDPGEGFTFTLATRPPFDLTALLDFFSRRQVEGLESINAQGCRRGLLIADAQGRAHPGWIEVLASPCATTTGLTVRVSPSLVSVIPVVLDRVRHAFDLSCRPQAIAQTLGSLASAHEGLRIPGALDGFEIAVRAIVGQQITVTQATRRVTDLVRAFGPPVDSPWPAVNRAFPSAAMLAEQTLESLSQVLQHRGRARALQTLAQEVAEGRLVLEPTGEIDAVLAALQALPGVGSWTAQYIALRALGWPDAFPHSDAGLLKALGTRDPKQALQRALIWRPYRGYAAIHLWRHGLPGQ